MTRMKLHFCEAIEIENLNKIERERKQRQQDWIAMFKRKLLQINLPKNTKVFDWKKILKFGLIWKGFEQKRYDWKEQN